METKRCTACNEVKATELFYATRKNKEGRMPQCIECTKQRNKHSYIRNKETRLNYRKSYYENNKEVIREKQKKYNDQHKDRKRDLVYQKTYGITLDSYLKMVVDQDCSCAICNTHQNNLDRRLHVDHNHINGKVRSLLCHNCNTAIGLMKEDTTLLQKMIDYLKENDAPR